MIIFGVCPYLKWLQCTLFENENMLNVTTHSLPDGSKNQQKNTDMFNDGFTLRILINSRIWSLLCSHVDSDSAGLDSCGQDV